MPLTWTTLKAQVKRSARKDFTQDTGGLEQDKRFGRQECLPHVENRPLWTGCFAGEDCHAARDSTLTNKRSTPMKSHTEYLTFNLPARMAFENITPKVAQIVKQSGVQEGLVLVNPKHMP